MSLVTGVFGYLDTGKKAVMEAQYNVMAKAVNEELHNIFDGNARFVLSLDQSTTCTGICIQDTQQKVICILDFMRLQTNKETYIEELRRLLSFMVKNLRLSLIVIENPLPINTKGNATLKALARTIKDWKNDIPEFYGVPFDTILPQQWKAKVLNKKKGKHRSAVKAEIAKDVCDIYPILDSYRTKCLATDFDSFDATGIMIGYLAQHFSTDGDKRNFGSAVYNSKIHVFLKYVPVDDVEDDSVLLLNIPKKSPIMHLKYNEDYSFYDNLRMVCSQYEIGSFVITDTLLFVNMLWESNLEFKRGFRFVCVVTRQGYFTQKQLEKAKEQNNYFYMA